MELNRFDDLFGAPRVGFNEYSNPATPTHDPHQLLRRVAASRAGGKVKMPLSPGDRLGPYEVLSPIGAGGMGEVWKARDTRLDRTVAIKTSKVEFNERFEREARAVAALNHPHICQIYDVGPNYLVMEFVEGTRLEQLHL